MHRPSHDDRCWASALRVFLAIAINGAPPVSAVGSLALEGLFACQLPGQTNGTGRRNR
jgi:hypothetical protein